MSHEIETMAYVGAVPWHGLGNPLSPNQPIEVWMHEAGMHWRIETGDVLFNAGGQNELHLKSFADNQVLFRSDTLAPLSVVSGRYKIVQPREVLEFYRELVAVGGFELETAGVLKGGRKFWALARTGQEALLRGEDRLKGYLPLASSCDGTLATTAQFTSVRVVCNNTLQVAVAHAGHAGGAVKVLHSTAFDPVAVKHALGIGVTAWETFMGDVRRLAHRKVTPDESQRFLLDLFGAPDRIPEAAAQPLPKAIHHVQRLFAGEALGSQLASADGTAWGLVNSVTEFVDHHRKARSQDFRLDSAWFGQGAALKNQAFQSALSLVA